MTELQNLLKQTADVYRSLVQHAKAASVPVPSEAQLGTGVKRGPDELEYDEFAAANATDWDDFQDEGADFLLFAACCSGAGKLSSHVISTFLCLECTVSRATHCVVLSACGQCASCCWQQTLVTAADIGGCTADVAVTV